MQRILAYMKKTTIFFSDENWEKIINHKIKLQKIAIESNTSNSDAVNDMLEGLK